MLLDVPASIADPYRGPRPLAAAKSEARSIFSPKSSQRSAVEALLEAAGRHSSVGPWNRLESRPIGPELVVLTMRGHPPGDATNYLGGVADTLQANRVGASLDHFGALAGVSLYADDSQIRWVDYAVEPQSSYIGYRVRIWVP